MKIPYRLPRVARALGALSALWLTTVGSYAQDTPPAASVASKVQVPASMRSAPFDVDRYLTVPPGFSIAVYARMNSPRFMALAPNGDLLVSQPGAGKVLLVRPNGSGDPVVSEFATGLRNPHDIVFHTIDATTYIYIAESNQINRYTYTAGDVTAQNRQVIITGLPDASTPELKGNYGHQLKNIALDGNHKLYVSIASTCNACLSDTQSDPVRGAIYQYNADGTGRRLFARGLRNAEGLAFVPGTNRLWVVVNNRDNIAYPFDNDFDGDGVGDLGKVLTPYVDNHPPEEFTYVQDGGNYGWPFCNPNPDATLNNMPFDRDYQFNPSGQVDCNGMTRISRGIQAHSAPLGLTFMPGTNFAAPYRSGAVAALHGSWNRAAKTGYKVVYFPWDSSNQVPTAQLDLVTGFLDNATQAVLGRPVDTAVDPQGSMLISDDYSGTIYKLSYSNLRTPENPANTVAGLDYKYYQGSFTVLPGFPALTPVKTGTVTNFDLSPRTQDDNFAFRYTGYVSVPTDGQYTFYTNSDDGSHLFIGDQLVVENNGLHPAQERSGTIGLKAGVHAIAVSFFERTGQQVLSVSYAGPGLSKQAIPASALSHVAPTALVSGGVYRLSPQSAPSKCLDVTAYSQAEGALMQQYEYKGQSNQQWRLVDTGSGYYKLVSLNSPSGTERVLDLKGCSTANGNNMVQGTWSGTGSSCQRWSFTLLSDGSYVVRPKAATDQGIDRCLDVASISVADGAKIQLWNYLSTNNPQQRWQLTLLSSPAASTTRSAALASQSAASTSALSVYPNPATAGQLTVSTSLAQAGDIVLRLTDGLGRVVRQRTLAAQAGAQRWTLEVRGLPQGLYLLQMQQGSQTNTRKVLIQP